jgi:hypothetical protein
MDDFEMEKNKDVRWRAIAVDKKGWSSVVREAKAERKGYINKEIEEEEGGGEEKGEKGFLFDDVFSLSV